jgi:xanthine dehydrogenase accessory factor
VTRPDIFDTIARLRAEGRPFCVATVVRTADATSAKAGAKAAVAEGRLIGHLGGACVAGAVREAAAAALADGELRLIRVKPAATAGTRDADGAELYRNGCPSGGTVDILIEPYRLPPVLAVLGASPVAAAIARHAALTEFRLAVAAMPEDLDGLPPADARVAGFDLTPLALGPDDFVVVAAQGKHDLDALRAALATAGHVAMIASRRKAAALVDRLRHEGVPADRLAQLRAPAGLDIGAIGPEEIAISVLAEIVRVMSRRRAARARVSEPTTG